MPPFIIGKKNLPEVGKKASTNTEPSIHGVQESG